MPLIQRRCPTVRTLKSAASIGLQVIHWLRLGCVPVGVLEGRPPPEKRQALRARFKTHTGFAGGGGGGGGAAAFQHLGSRVGAMLRGMVRDGHCTGGRVAAR